MSLTKLSITIETSVRDKLPKTNKSAFINQILKQHFQREGAEQLYEYITSRMKKEGLISDGSVGWNEVKTTPRTCCALYPNEECGHWYTDNDGIRINEITKERHA